MIELTLAINDYEHVRDIASGRVRPEGIDLTCLTLPLEEIFSIPWSFDALSQARALLGDDPWPYGLEPNRAALRRRHRV